MLLCFLLLPIPPAHSKAPTSTANSQPSPLPQTNPKPFLHKMGLGDGAKAKQALSEQKNQIEPSDRLPIRKKAKIIRSAPMRWMQNSDYVDFTTAEVKYDPLVQVGELNRVTVTLSPPLSGATIYMNVSSVCEENLHSYCEEQSPGSGYLIEEMKIVLTDSGNGSYEGSYRISHTDIGFVTISLYTLDYGLLGHCYNNMELKGDSVKRVISEEINYSWNLGSVLGVKSDDVSVRWKGKLMIPETREYEFRVLLDDIARLYIDGELIADLNTDDDLFPNAKREFKANITMGEHDIVLEFGENDNYANFKFQWKHPASSDYQIISKDYFRYVNSIFISDKVEVTCRPQYYLDVDEQKCLYCPKGTYNGNYGQFNCTLCPEGTYNDQTGKVSLADCKECPRGTYNNKTGAIHIDQCTLCPSGTYSDETRQTSLSDCLLCGTMTYGDREGLTRCKECVAGSFSEVQGSTSCPVCHPLCEKCYGSSNAECNSCSSGAGAVQTSMETCECPAKKYYDEEEERCKDCHASCSSCGGPLAEDCYNCNATLGFNVEGKPGHCVVECEDGYYKDAANSICKSKSLLRVECQSPCKDCKGPGKCYSCSSPDEVVHEYVCKPYCPSDHKDVSGVCLSTIKVTLECHDDCATCDDLSKSGCTSCRDGKHLHNGQCLAQCPFGFYPDSSVCLPCPYSCANCTASTCFECIPNYYRDGDECVFIDKCPEGTYNDSTTQSCEQCSKACSGCHGPTDKDCADCNRAEGYVEDDSGDCRLLQCAEGTYLSANKVAPLFKCEPCDESCKTCSSAHNCLECKKGYMKFNASSLDESLCSTCPRGYTTADSGECKGNGSEQP